MKTTPQRYRDARAGHARRPFRRPAGWALPLALLLACFLLGPLPAKEPAPAKASTPAIFDQIQEVIASLSEITGFELRRRIEPEVIGRAEFQRFLDQRMREEIDPEDIRIEELLLKKFGFVPPDFNLRETMVALYTEQAAAFYDFRRRKLFMLDTDDTELQEAAFVHELAHALADQEFRLEKYLKRNAASDDGAMARMSVLEGQATWLMSEFSMKRMGISLVGSPEMANLLSRNMGDSTLDFPVLKNAPMYIRESLMFPYASGLRFQQAVIDKLGKDGFAEVFRNPPDSTQQILHPEKYFGRSAPEDLEMPRLRREGRYRKLAVGTLGEFDYAVLLRQFADDDATRRLAPQWRAGQYQLLEHKKDKRLVLIQASKWDTPGAAGQMARHLLGSLEKKWNRYEAGAAAPAGDGQTAGIGDDGHFLLLLAGRYVYLVEGMAAPDGVGRWPRRATASLGDQRAERRGESLAGLR